MEIMNLIQKFMEMKDSELRIAFVEFKQHEKTGVLQDGILRNIIDEIDGIDIINVEHALLRELAGRWFYNS
jgi:hypothetical protein